MTNLKIGISVNPFGDIFERYGENKFLELSRQGYCAVDYAISNTDLDLYSLEDSQLKQKIQKEKELARAAGITISQAHGPWRYPPKDDTAEDREERLEKMKKAVIISALLDCKYLVVHPIMPFGTKDTTLGLEQNTWDLNLDFFGKLVAFAKKYDVTICLENMPMLDFSLSTPTRILEFVKTINDDHFKICFDTGHVAVFPNLSVGNEVRKLGDYIKCFHIHDNLGDRDSHLFPTKGIIGWADFSTAVNEIGYVGVLSLETAPSSDCDNNQFAQESITLNQTIKEIMNKQQV